MRTVLLRAEDIPPCKVCGAKQTVCAEPYHTERQTGFIFWISCTGCYRRTGAFGETPEKAQENFYKLEKEKG